MFKDSCMLKKSKLNSLKMYIFSHFDANAANPFLFSSGYS